jgi:dynein heavy chain
LSPGVDPADNFFRFADDMRFAKKCLSISLGQGQGARAENLLKEGIERGFWVLLQNCHLCPSWMPSLEKIMETLTPDRVHRDFRLWLTSMPTDKFPVPILQSGLKITMEPPRGLKANLLRTYSNLSEDSLQNGEKSADWRKLLFSLSFFHAVVQERRKFGPLGWNTPYDFTDGDFRVCMRQLRIFINEYEPIPFKVLKYTAGEINYGGRVTDDWDRRVIMNMLEDFYQPSVLTDGYNFSESGIYRSIPAGSYQDYITYIKSLPMDEPAEAFAMDNNANITFAQKEAYAIFDTLVMLMPKASTSAGSGKSREALLLESIDGISKRLPKPFDVAQIIQKYPPSYRESMSTVLAQEAARYNKVLVTVDTSLREAQKALKGLVAISESIEAMCSSIYINAVPQLWSSKAYPSLKPLSAWVADLEARINFFQSWISSGQPQVFWISGFYFPQAFLTAALQNYARKNSIAIDQLGFDFSVLKAGFDPKSAPEDGCYIRGLYLEGARWNGEALDLSKPSELFVEMPIICISPRRNRSVPTGVYRCPLYKTLTRSGKFSLWFNLHSLIFSVFYQGTLSSTGHSTNYVMTIELPSKKPESFWTKRGVALFCALNF